MYVIKKFNCTFRKIVSAREKFHIIVNYSYANNVSLGRIWEIFSRFVSKAVRELSPVSFDLLR